MQTSNTEAASVALVALTECVYRHIAEAGEATNTQIARALGLETSWHDGSASNYLTWAILGELVKAGRIVKNGKLYSVAV